MNQARLLLHTPNGQTIEHELHGEISIGRAPDNRLTLDDPKVSRAHALVRPGTEGGFVILDLGSGNGTFVNQHRVVAATRLHSGDTIGLGSTILEFVDPDEVRVPRFNRGSEETAVDPGEGEEALLGTSAPMAQLFLTIEKASASHIAVLIEGESGTGKELVARSIHSSSKRAGKPFIAVNCAAFAETLLESELFGHRRGAFTGALADRAGLFETADGGTVFLDEIGEMSLSVQPKLLRVLQEKEVARVGETKPRKVDVRIVSATNRNLLEEVKSGAFRADLYYRLSTFPIRVPALREHREDIPMLARRFVTTSARSHGKETPSLDVSALEALTRYDWPGNVRELQNEIQRSVALVASGGLIAAQHLSDRVVPDGGDGAQPATLDAPAFQTKASETWSVKNPVPLRDARNEFEARYIQEVLAREGGNIAAAARVLGFSRLGLYKKIKELGLR